MQIENTHRDDSLKNASAAKIHLYNSPESGGTLRTIAQRNNFYTNKELYRKFALTVGDIILGFYKIEDTVPLLQQELELDPRTAALLGADVLDFLAPLSNPQFTAPETNVTPAVAVSAVTPFVTHTAEHIEPAVPVSAHTSPILSVLTTNPAYTQITEKRPGALPNPYTAPELRTMAADMAETPHTQNNYTPIQTDDTPTYSSQQPTVRTPLSELPTYHNPSAPQQIPPVAPLEPPRWGA